MASLVFRLYECPPTTNADHLLFAIILLSPPLSPLNLLPVEVYLCCRSSAQSSQSALQFSCPQKCQNSSTTEQIQSRSLQEKNLLAAACNLNSVAAITFFANFFC